MKMMALLRKSKKSSTNFFSGVPGPGGQIIELAPDQQAQYVHAQGVFLMHGIAIITGAFLLGHLTAVLALAPAFGVITRWVIKRFSSGRSHPMAELAAVLSVNLMLLFAGGLYIFSPESSQSSQEALGLLPVAGYACIVLFDLMAFKSTPARLAMVGGATSVLLLVHLGISQSLVNSAVVCFLFSMIWVALVARRESAFSGVLKNGEKANQSSNIRFGFRTGFLVLSLSIPLTIVFFLLFPRIPIDMLRSEQLEKGGAKIGLSDSLSLGSISELKKSNDPAFNAVFKGSEPKSTSFYWRAMVLDQLDGSVWSSSKNQTGYENNKGSQSSGWQGNREIQISLRDDAPVERFSYVVSWDGTQANGRPVVLDGTLGRLLVAFDDKNGTLAPRDDGTYALPETVGRINLGLQNTPELHSLAGFSSPSYQLDAKIFSPMDSKESLQAEQSELVESSPSNKATDQKYPRDPRDPRKDWTAHWTNLPPGFNPRTQEFGKSLRKKFVNDEKIIAAFMATVRNEDYHYTLRPPQLGAQAIDDFFLTTRAGFCEHYASAFVVAMRGAGIPARLISGYISGPSSDGRIKVMQSDAHAWAEVWLPERGWIRQDPTSSIAPSRVDPDAANAGLESAPQNLFGFAELSWRKYSFRAEKVWKEGMLSFDADSQSKVFKKMGLSNVSKPLLLILSLVLVIVAALLWQYFGMKLWLLLQPRSGTAISRLLEKKCLRAGIIRQPGQTWRDLVIQSSTGPVILLGSSDAKELMGIVEKYEQLLYANGSLDANHLILRQLAKRIRGFKPTRQIGTPRVFVLI